MSPCELAGSRRTFLKFLAGSSLLAAAPEFARARQSYTIEQLIAAAKGEHRLSPRIDLISRAWLGTKYKANTLIGSPKQDERLVVRDDAFDCVTYCEMVLAAALASNRGELESWLRKIRYHDGQLRWDQRNHYFADWAARNIANGLCQRVAFGQEQTIEKSVNVHPALGLRRLSLTATPQTSFLANRRLLSTGDILGFVSRRAGLDYFHTGFVAFAAAGGELVLRHASQSRGRVLDDNMERFVRTYRVRYVTVLRPQDQAASAGTSAASG